VIDDGPRFKLGLYRAAKRFDLDIERWPSPPDRGGDEWGDYWQYRFEETLFLIGLGIRKLVEANKLSVEAQARMVPIAFAPIVGAKAPDTANFHRIEKFYNLDDAQLRSESIINLCNAIVHSFVLVPRFSWSGPAGLRLVDFVLASDRERGRGAYVVSWRTFVDDLVWHVYRDDVVALFVRRDGKGDEIRVPSSTATSAQDLRKLLDQFGSLSARNRSAIDRFGLQHRQPDQQSVD